MAKKPTRYNELRKGLDYNLIVKATPTDEEYVLNFVGSSEDPDRHGDIVKSDGWRLDSYLANPVFLWGHDHRQLPIGKAIDVKVNKKEKRLEFKIKFAVEEYGFAATVYKLFKSGFLNATSVGFMVHDWEYDEEKDAFVLTDNELLELSAVTVPANPQALIMNQAKGLFDDRDVDRLKQEGMLKSVIKAIEDQIAADKAAEKPEVDNPENKENKTPDGDTENPENKENENPENKENENPNDTEEKQTENKENENPDNTEEKSKKQHTIETKIVIDDTQWKQIQEGFSQIVELKAEVEKLKELVQQKEDTSNTADDPAGEENKDGEDPENTEKDGEDPTNQEKDGVENKDGTEPSETVLDKIAKMLGVN